MTIVSGYDALNGITNRANVKESGRSIEHPDKDESLRYIPVVSRNKYDAQKVANSSFVADRSNA